MKEEGKKERRKWDVHVGRLSEGVLKGMVVHAVETATYVCQRKEKRKEIYHGGNEDRGMKEWRKRNDGRKEGNVSRKKGKKKMHQGVNDRRNKGREKQRKDIYQ
jgi:hypothetical protein